MVDGWGCGYSAISSPYMGGQNVSVAGQTAVFFKKSSCVTVFTMYGVTKRVTEVTKRVPEVTNIVIFLHAGEVRSPERAELRLSTMCWATNRVGLPDQAEAAKRGEA